jgi:hypothetical protein
MDLIIKFMVNMFNITEPIFLHINEKHIIIKNSYDLYCEYYLLLLGSNKVYQINGGRSKIVWHSYYSSYGGNDKDYKWYSSSTDIGIPDNEKEFFNIIETYIK